MRTFVALFLALPVLAGCDFLLPDDDDAGDPGLVGDANGTVYRLAAGIDSVSIDWTADVAAADTISFASVGDTIVVGAGAEVTGLDPTTGENLWSSAVVDQVVAMTSGGGLAYALSFTALTALDPADGAVVWTQDFTVEGITGVSFAEPVFAGGGVILGGDPVRRFDGATGAPDGTYATGDTEMLGLAVDGGDVFVGGRSGIAGLSSGLVEAWLRDTVEDVDRIVPTDAGIVYSQVGAGLSLISADGSPGWSDDDGSVYDALAASEGLVIGARLQGTVHGWGSSDGTQAWVTPDAASPVRGLGVSGATVLYAGGTFVRGLNPSDGSLLWEWSPAANPVGLAAF